jgi:formylglycine-generating enzyme required for sulfatase activity
VLPPFIFETLVMDLGPLWPKAREEAERNQKEVGAEEERPAREEAQKEQVARYRAEGRIEITAPFVINPHGRLFLPGAGKTEWFKDLDSGPEMVVVSSGSFTMGSPKDEPEREVAKAGCGKPSAPGNYTETLRGWAVCRYQR